MRLLWLPDVLRRAGLVVHEYDGWQSRGYEDFGPLRGVVCHATAGSRTSTDAGEMNTLWVTGSDSAPAPISQLYLSRSGDWWVGGSGRCNHVLIGDRGPHMGYGNDNLIGIEAQNDNRGEPWSAHMLDSYQRGVAALCRQMGWASWVVVAHREHQSDKTDPVGIDMNAFRQRVTALLNRQEEEDTMLHGQVPEGEKTIVVATPWDKSQISFGCDFGRARLRVAEHEVNKGWYITTIDVSDKDPARTDLPVRPNIDRRSIRRVPVDDTDTLDTPVGYLAWWK